MKDIKDYLAFLKGRGIFTIARIVVFHDNKVAKQKPDWAIHSSIPSSARESERVSRGCLGGQAWVGMGRSHQ